jgi:hypothetical protein
MDKTDLNNRFVYHAPKDKAAQTKHERTRAAIFEAACFVDTHCPDGREKSTAITKLEEAMFWANAAIARSE